VHGPSDVRDADCARCVYTVELNHAGVGGPHGAVGGPSHQSVDVSDCHAALEHDKDGGAAEGVDVVGGDEIGFTAEVV